ncbi:hypothetical protein F5Y19DRAFT_132838 [Xylariaceae sp. FL1651]|nr:hypothetical protein F5Y19DRAFT_132838 [Xylariaceae sp. FL1651]
MTCYRQSRRWLLQLTQLLTIISTTSAVSLQDFQTVSLFQVPSLSCLSAYGSTIRGCSRSDFKDGIQCSPTCAKGVQEDATNIIAACQGIDVNENSLLGLTLRGGLLGAVCPGFQAPSVTSTVKPTTTRSFLTTIQTQETSTSTTMSTSIKSTTESSSTVSTTTTATTTSASIGSSTTIQTITSATDTPTISTIPTEATTTTTATALSTSTPSATKSSDGSQSEQPGRGSSGGGSPFDTVLIAGSERVLQIETSMAAALTAALITAFFMR